jgi:hypothetical protein
MQPINLNRGMHDPYSSSPIPLSSPITVPFLYSLHKQSPSTLLLQACSRKTLYWPAGRPAGAGCMTDGRRLAEVLVAEDGRVGEGPVEPPFGDVAVGGLGEVDAVPAPVVGRVLAGVRARFAALGGQVEVVLADARRAAARPRRLLQEP